MVYFAFHCLILFISLLYFWSRIKQTLFQSEGLRLVCEIYAPVTLIGLYGVFALPIYFEDSQDRFNYAGVYFTEYDIFLSFVTVSIAVIIMAMILRAGLTPLNNTLRRDNSNEIETARSVNIVFYIILILDLFARLQLVLAGEYFIWLKAAFEASGEIDRGTDWTTLQERTELYLFSVMFFKYYLRPSRGMVLLILIMFMATLAKGDRSSFFLCLFSSFFIYISGVNERKKIVILFRRALYVLLIAIYASWVIVNMRAQFKDNLVEILTNPQKGLETIVYVYFPKALVGYEPQLYDSTDTDLNKRIGLWSGSFASELNGYYDDVKHMPLNFFMEAITLPVPSFIYSGDKPIVAQGPRTALWYGLGANRPNISYLDYDGGSTVFSDIHKYAGIIGVGLLAALLASTILSVIYFTAWYLGPLQRVIIVPFMLSMDIRANNFATIFVHLEIQLFIIFLIYIVYNLSKVRLN